MPRALAPRLVAALVAASLPACAARPRPPESPELSAGAKLLPARLRRLSNVEYERSVGEVLGAPVAFAERLPEDMRLEGFTENAHQTVVGAWSTRADAVIREVVQAAVPRQLQSLNGCQPAASEPCRRRWLAELARKAYRRAPTEPELAALGAVFQSGQEQGRGLAGGVELALRAALQAPSALYLSELGGGGVEGATTTLTADEIASAIAFTVRGGPPDAALLAAAERGELADPARREHEARRLIGQSDARHHFRRFVLEWLEVDELEDSAKSAERFPEYEALRGKMLEETAAFVDEVMVHGGASVRSLLDAGFATVDPTMARFYGLRTWGVRASLAGSGRTGVLQQASFLAAHAHEDSTSPVKRGDFVLRKLLCEQVLRPSEVGVEVVIPPASPSRTTRERFAAHVTTPSCAACHRTMDAIGFSFEAFDAQGRKRKDEAGHALDTRARFTFDGRELDFADSLELTRWLAGQARVRECFARHAFRFVSGQADPAIERSFLEIVRQLPDELAGNLIEELVLYVKSDFFVRREVRTP